MANYMDRFKRGKDAEEARSRALGMDKPSKPKPKLEEVKVTAKRKPALKPKLEEVKVTAKRKPALKSKSEGERARDIALGRQAPPKKSAKPKTSSSPVAGKSYQERGDRAAAAKPAKPKISTPKADTNRVQAKFGQGSSETVMHKGKKMANVTAEQLKKSGLSLRAYMNQWNKTGKRPS